MSSNDDTNLTLEDGFKNLRVKEHVTYFGVHFNTTNKRVFFVVFYCVVSYIPRKECLNKNNRLTQQEWQVKIETAITNGISLFVATP